MNKYKIIYFLFLSIAFSSCGKWLTLNPEDQIKEGELYSTAAGFHTQINGIYKVLSEPTLYGRELSYGFIDVIAQVYEERETSNYGYKNAMKYDYTEMNTKKYTDSFWPKYFNAIANSNSIIHYANSADPELFHFKNVELKCIRGEAYALRAMLHFDVLRLYTPAPKINRTNKIIPYVKDFPTTVPMAISTNDVLENIIADLELAHELTMEIDTLNIAISDVGRRLEFVGDSGVTRFTSYRGYRLNHYAIKALLARVYLYNDDEVNALKYANELISLNTSRWFKFNTKRDIEKKKNIKLYDDVIFALFSNHLTTYYDQESNQEDTDLVANSKVEIFVPSEKPENDIKDYRYLQYRNVGGGKIASNKYKEAATGEDSKFSNKLIPMLRISEMYYIAAECLFDVDKTKATENLNYVQSSRGATNSPLTNDKGEFRSFIIDEMRKELVGEGQLFFYYKRFDYLLMNSLGKEIKPNYILPIPDNNNV